MNAEQYLNYLIETAKSCGEEYHSMPVQVSELELLKAMLAAEAKQRDSKKKK
jgi:hypothetical protein